MPDDSRRRFERSQNRVRSQTDQGHLHAAFAPILLHTGGSNCERDECQDAQSVFAWLNAGAPPVSHTMTRLLLMLLATVIGTTANNWPSWRGPNANGAT